LLSDVNQEQAKGLDDRLGIAMNSRFLLEDFRFPIPSKYSHIASGGVHLYNKNSSQFFLNYSPVDI
jgi:hypothetical protein